MKEIFRYAIIFITIIFIMLLINYKVNETTKFTDEYSLNVIKVDTFWIYEISKKDELFIRQEFIPVVEGKQVFKSKKDAEIIGEIVLKKLASNKIPAVTMEDIKSNKIIFNDI